MMLWSLVGALVLGTVGGGWYARDFIETELASKEEVVIAGSKADYLIERREEALVRQIAELERLRSLTATQKEHLQSLRRQLEEIRRVRRGK